MEAIPIHLYIRGINDLSFIKNINSIEGKFVISTITCNYPDPAETYPNIIPKPSVPENVNLVIGDTPPKYYEYFNPESEQMEIYYNMPLTDDEDLKIIERYP